MVVPGDIAATCADATRNVPADAALETRRSHQYRNRNRRVQYVPNHLAHRFEVAARRVQLQHEEFSARVMGLPEPATQDTCGHRINRAIQTTDHHADGARFGLRSHNLDY